MCLLGRICIEGDFAGRLSEVIPTSTWKTLYQSMLSSGAGETPKLQLSSEGKDRPGHQHPEGVGRHSAYLLLPA